MNFGQAISILRTPGDTAGRAQLNRARLAGEGWTSEMKRAVPLATCMILMLLAGPLLHHQFLLLAENLLFWGALAAVFMGALGLIMRSAFDARSKAMAELGAKWASREANSQSVLQTARAIARLARRAMATSAMALAQQKSNFSPPAAPGGRSLPHLCLTPRLAQRPRAAAQRLPCEY